MISFAGINAKAESLTPVKNITLRLDHNWKDSTQGFLAQLVWEYKNSSDIKGFYIYEAEGKTTNPADFHMAATIDLSNQEDFWFRQDSGFASIYIASLNITQRRASFYITAYGDSDESNPGSFVFGEVPNNYYYQLYLDNTTNAKVGVEYTSNVKLQTNAQYSAISFKLLHGPSGMTIDESTGALTWTPQQNGVYTFVVGAKFEVESQMQNITQTLEIRVRTCDNPGLIYGYVHDSKGELVKHGYVWVTSKMDSLNDTLNFQHNFGMQAEINNGFYLIRDLDQGYYYLIAQDDNGDWGATLPTWFNGTTDINNATPVMVNCGDSTVASWNLLQNKTKVRFTTTPENTKIKLGDTFTYDADAEGGDEQYPLVFQIQQGPKEASINSETGELAFTPTHNGVYPFNLIVSRKYPGNVDSKQIDIQNFNVVVRQCDQLSSIVMQFKNEDGEAIKYGYAILLQMNDHNDANNPWGFTQTVQFDNGMAKFKDLDAGDYYLQVSAYNMVMGDSTSHGGNDTIVWKSSEQYYSMWYKDAFDMKNATPITIECNSNFTDEMILKKVPELKNYSVSGHVTDAADNTPITHAVIQFIGTEKNTGMQASTACMSDSKGKYFIQLSDNYTWIAYCQAGGLLYGRKNDTLWNSDKIYFPEYYNDVTDPKDAQVFDLTENLTDIDFALSEISPYDNSMSGNTVNSDNEQLPNIGIIAYLVKAADNNADNLYFGRTVETDENGHFKLDNLIPGQYIIFAWDNSFTYAPGYYHEGTSLVQSWEEATQVTVDESGNSGDYTLTMDEFKHIVGICSVHGKVGRHKNTTKVGDDIQSSDALQGAVVYVTDLQGNTIGSISTKEDGSFEIGNLAPGTYRLVAGKVGFQTYINEFTVGNDSPAAAEEVQLSAGTTGVNDLIDANNTLSAYPNPASNVISVKFQANASITSVKMLDNTGRIVYSQQVSTIQGENEVTIQASTIPQGAYFIVVGNSNGTNMIPVAVIK